MYTDRRRTNVSQQVESAGQKVSGYFWYYTTAVPYIMEGQAGQAQQQI